MEEKELRNVLTTKVFVALAEKIADLSSLNFDKSFLLGGSCAGTIRLDKLSALRERTT